MKRVCWVDGRIEPLENAVVRADDSAFSEGRGCYSSARIEGGGVRFEERHVARLVGAAQDLRLGDLDPDLVRQGLRELAEAAFGKGDGVVRFQASRDGVGGLHLVGVPRDLGPEPSVWSAIVVTLSHEGADLAPGLKVSSRLSRALAGDASNDAGVDEALLVDGGGRLVEGARSNILVAGSDARLATPPVAAGPVAGIARGVVLERVPGIEERSIDEAELRAAREIVAVNAVRGACAITQLDGAPVGDGKPGPCSRRLADALAYD